MEGLQKIVLLAVLAFSPTTAAADANQVETGGDTFISGALVNEILNAPGDTFVAARTVIANGQSKGDLHATGFDVTVNAEASEDLYAFGASVLIQSRIAQDLTAAGLSVRTGKGSETRGNARLFGRTVTIEGPVSGSILATAQDVVLNAPVNGDLLVLARSISFGPEASVAGTLTYGSRERISVPERVAPADRVVFDLLSPSAARQHWRDMRDEMPVLPTLASLVFGFVVSLLFL